MLKKLKLAFTNAVANGAQKAWKFLGTLNSLIPHAYKEEYDTSCKLGASHESAFWKAAREGTHDIVLQATISGATGALVTLLAGAANNATVGSLSWELALGGAAAGFTFKTLSSRPNPPAIA